MRNTYASISLDAYEHNLNAIRGLLHPKTRLMAVVKANAYGHGLIPIAMAAQQAGADFLGVALAEEGAQLRRAGVRLPILVLAGLNRESTRLAVQSGLTLTVFTTEHLKDAQTAASQVGKTVDVHVKLDTGMGRIGTRGEMELKDLLEELRHCSMLRLTGAFTHFACADSVDQSVTNRQLERFRLQQSLLPAGILLHASGSAGLLNYPDAHFDMVRAGLATYGYAPIETGLHLEKVMSLVAEITHVKTIGEGDAVSYGGRFVATQPTRVATLAIGYGDGYSRLLSNQADVLINGKRCRVLGSVCMDQLMVDVTQAGEVKVGDMAVLLGKMGEEEVDARELAGLIGTIPYEVLLNISQRVPRTYAREK